MERSDIFVFQQIRILDKEIAQLDRQLNDFPKPPLPLSESQQKEQEEIKEKQRIALTKLEEINMDFLASSSVPIQR